ncbi:MAG: hypothetical protein WC029_07880 [Sulfuricella sp.]|jgi:hypothetical protein
MMNFRANWDAPSINPENPFGRRPGFLAGPRGEASIPGGDARQVSHSNSLTLKKQIATENTEFTEKNQHVTSCLWLTRGAMIGKRGQAPGFSVLSVNSVA